MTATTWTFDSDIISDLHKDAYGMRPGPGFFQRWEEATDAERQEQWDWLLAVLERRMEEEKAQAKNCIQNFEELVNKTISSGARNRETALRWIMDASTCNGDWEFLCYHHGLPYSYFKKAA